MAVAALLLLILTPFVFNGFGDVDQQLVNQPEPANQRELGGSQLAVKMVGLLYEQDCTWEQRPQASGSRFAAGKLSLATGVAKLSFDSGTDVVLEAPCTLDVTSADSATLLAGNVFVDVTETSNGFTLGTPEAKIIDEGTQYAVALADEMTEVHVFDGSVLWIVGDQGDDRFQDRIESGQAKSFQRSDPTPKRFCAVRKTSVREAGRATGQTAGWG